MLLRVCYPLSSLYVYWSYITQIASCNQDKTSSANVIFIPHSLNNAKSSWCRSWERYCLILFTFAIFSCTRTREIFSRFTRRYLYLKQTFGIAQTWFFTWKLFVIIFEPIPLTCDNFLLTRHRKYLFQNQLTHFPYVLLVCRRTF